MSFWNVIPAKAGIQCGGAHRGGMDSRLRGNDAVFWSAL